MIDLTGRGTTAGCPHSSVPLDRCRLCEPGRVPSHDDHTACHVEGAESYDHGYADGLAEWQRWAALQVVATICVALVAVVAVILAVAL